MLSPEAQRLIINHPAGMVATVNDDGSPAVSPKATFVVLNESAIAFGNLRSPGTMANLRKRPAVEVCFIDVVLRKAVRVRGTATIVRQGDAEASVHEAFEETWAAFKSHMSHFVKIDVMSAELVLSPAYDHGINEDELRTVSLEKLNALYATAGR